MNTQRLTSSILIGLLLILTSLSMNAQNGSPMSAFIQLESNALAIGAPADSQGAFQLMGSATCTDTTVQLVPQAAQATGTEIGGKQVVVKTGTLKWAAPLKAGNAITGVFKFTLSNGLSYRMDISVPGSGVKGSCKIQSSNAQITVKQST